MLWTIPFLKPYCLPNYIRNHWPIFENYSLWHFPCDPYGIRHNNLSVCDSDMRCNHYYTCSGIWFWHLSHIMMLSIASTLNPSEAVDFPQILESYLIYLLQFRTASLSFLSFYTKDHSSIFLHQWCTMDTSLPPLDSLTQFFFL